MTTILDGKLVSDARAEKLKQEVATLPSKPCAVIVQIGDDAASSVYIEHKKKFAARIGALVLHKQYPIDVSENELIADIKNWNNDDSIHGMIVQLPIPAHLNKNTIFETIDPKKDIDGLTPTNLNHLLEGSHEGFIPATTKGILSLLDHYNVEISGKKVVVVGRSLLVGKPTALALLNRDATVTICHSRTENLAEITKLGDILIVAAGKQHLITKKYVSANQTIIDVGIHVVQNSGKKIVGDVDFEEVKNIVGAISPVPGGVGPMTIVSLFENLLSAYRKA